MCERERERCPTDGLATEVCSEYDGNGSEEACDIVVEVGGPVDDRREQQRCDRIQHKLTCCLPECIR